jgi:hypothetical protein
MNLRSAAIVAGAGRGIGRTCPEASTKPADAAAPVAHFARGQVAEDQ